MVQEGPEPSSGADYIKVFSPCYRVSFSTSTLLAHMNMVLAGPGTHPAKFN